MEKRSTESAIVGRPCVLAALVFVLYFLYFLFCTPTGDDWAYARAIGGASPVAHSPVEFLKWAWGHYNWANGRFGNYLMPFLILLPGALRALISGVFVSVLCYQCVKLSGTGGTWLGAAVVAVAVVGFQWWDSFMIFAVETNYVWPAVFLLGFYSLLFSGTKLPLWLAAVVALLAGCSHEAGSIPLACGIAAYFALNRLRPNGRQWLLIGFFAAGILFLAAAPGIRVRSAAGHTADDSPLWLFAKSDYLAGVLWAVGILISAFKPGRKRLAGLFKSPVSVLAWATVPAVGISVWSGIVGRPGFFANVYSLIILATLAAACFRRRRRGLWWAFTVMFTAQMGATCCWQMNFDREHRAFIAAYLSSPSGVVEMDFRRDDQAPWYTFGKVRGVPDADDDYNLYCLRNMFRPAGPIPIAADGGVERLDALPEDAVLRHCNLEDMPPSYRFYRDGQIWIARPAGGGYFADRLVQDPGDREN